MPQNKFSIASQALVKVGGQPITGFDDGTTESDVASVLYEDYVRGQIGLVRWNWAKTQFSLNQNAATPLEGWDYGYDVPSDLLILHRVTIGDNDVKFERFKDKIFSDEDNDSDDLVAHYTYRVDENDWPADFTLAVITGLAADFSMSLAREADFSTLLEKKAINFFAQARRNDAQGQTPKAVRVGRLTGARMASAGR